MILSIIAAMSENQVIGADGRIPWHIPDDLKHVACLTRGHILMMGRKTFESLPRVLPDRIHIVISGHPESKSLNASPDCSERIIVVSSPQDALTAAQHLINTDPSLPAEVFIFGGGEIYRQFLPLCQRMYITLIRRRIEGDTFFPPIDPDHWEEASRRSLPDCDFIEYRTRSFSDGLQR